MSYPLIRYPLMLDPSPQVPESIFNTYPPIPIRLSLPLKPVLYIPDLPIYPGEFKELHPKLFSRYSFIAGSILILLLRLLWQLIGSWTGIILFAVLVSWLYSSYPERLEAFHRAQIKHDETTRGYPLEKEQWKEACRLECRSHRQALQSWNAKKSQVEQEYEQAAEFARTQKAIDEFRSCKIREALLRTKSYDAPESDAPRGWAEHSTNCLFGPELYTYFPEKIYERIKVGSRTPDFAYIDPDTGLHIDIEIDEPYIPRQYPNQVPLEPTHYIGSDDSRDQEFNQRGWIVIHFSEEQVIRHSRSCCKEVAKIIFRLTENQSVLSSFEGIRDLQTYPQWSWSEALQMAEQRSRLTYSGN